MWRQSVVREHHQHAVPCHVLRESLNHPHIRKSDQIWGMSDVMVVGLSPVLDMQRHTLTLVDTLNLKEEADRVESMRRKELHVPIYGVHVKAVRCTVRESLATPPIDPFELIGDPVGHQ